jgi:transposase-like protein
MASKFGVHANQISSWKKQLQDGATELFADGRQQYLNKPSDYEQQLCEQIGRLKMEVEWLKENLPNSPEEKRRWIDPDHSSLSIAGQ